MNYNALVQKYFPQARVVVHDRTYEGLEWLGPGEKPRKEVFESFQAEEDRLDRAAGRQVREKEGLMQEKQRQARAQAEQDLIPFQQKLGTYYEEQRLAFLKLSQEALEVKNLLGVKNIGVACWQEITEAQELLHAKAQQYLEETKHYMAWDEHKIPAEVLAGREQAHSVLEETKVVFAEWNQLRASEMPSREEIAEAIRKGGEHLKAMKKRCKEIAGKYTKPKRQLY